MSTQDTAQSRVSLRTYAAILLRRRWVVLLSVVGVLASTLAASVSMRPVYVASTTLQIEEKEFSIGGSELLKPMEAFLGTKTSLIDAEVAILESRSVAENVVTNMNLRTWLVELPRGMTLSMVSIDAGDRAAAGRYELVFESDTSSFSLWNVEDDRSIGEGQVGAPFDSEGISLTISGNPGEKGDRIMFDVLEFSQAVGLLRKSMSVAPMKNTNIIQLTVTGTVPEQISVAADAIAETYRLQNLGRNASRALSAGQFLQGQLDIVREDLVKSEQALEEFKSVSGVVTLDEQTRTSLSRLTDVELETARIEAQISQVESLLETLADTEGRVDGGLIISTSGSDDPVVVELSANLAALEVERSSLLTRYTPGHPDVIALDSQIAEARSNLTQEIIGVINGLRERRRTMASIVARYEESLRGLPEAEMGLVSLTRESEIAAALYTYLLQTFQEARIAEASEIGNVRIIDPAIPPGSPIRPRLMLNGVLATIVGLLLGVGGAFVVDRLDNTVKGREELEKAVGLPVFGVIPDAHSFASTERDNGSSQQGSGLLLSELPGPFDSCGSLSLDANEPGVLRPSSPDEDTARLERPARRRQDHYCGEPGHLFRAGRQECPSHRR